MRPIIAAGGGTSCSAPAAIASSLAGQIIQPARGTLRPSSSTVALEEVVDELMGFGLDPPIQVLVIPTLFESNRVERVLVLGVAMTDVGPRRQRGAFLDGELTSPSDATAAHDGSTHGGVLGDRFGEGCVLGCEVQKGS